MVQLSKTEQAKWWPGFSNDQWNKRGNKWMATWMAFVTFHPASQLVISLTWACGKGGGDLYSGSWWQTSSSNFRGPSASSLFSLWAPFSSSLLAKFTCSSSVSRQLSHLSSPKKRDGVSLKQLKRDEKVCFRWAILSTKHKSKIFHYMSLFFSAVVRCHSFW